MKKNTNLSINSIICIFGCLSGVTAFASPATQSEFLISAWESKELYVTKAEKATFRLVGASSSVLECREGNLGLKGTGTLYQGWNASRVQEFDDRVQGSRYLSYEFVECRGGQLEAIGWFPAERRYELSVTEERLKQPRSNKIPLLFRVKSLVQADQESYWTCGAQSTKTVVEDAATFQRSEVRTSCERISQLDEKKQGLPQFLDNPGALGALVSYSNWKLPSVPASASAMKAATQRALKVVPEGRYIGVMSTLEKRCAVEIRAQGDGFTVEHSILSGTRTRTRNLSVQSDRLLGTLAGFVYADPLRVEAEAEGVFEAIRFLNSDGKPTTLRFESTQGKDGLRVRINGSEAYCRRLKKL